MVICGAAYGASLNILLAIYPEDMDMAFNDLFGGGGSDIQRLFNDWRQAQEALEIYLFGHYPIDTQEKAACVWILTHQCETAASRLRTLALDTPRRKRS